VSERECEVDLLSPQQNFIVGYLIQVRRQDRQHMVKKFLLFKIYLINDLRFLDDS